MQNHKSDYEPAGEQIPRPRYQVTPVRGLILVPDVTVPGSSMGGCIQRNYPYIHPSQYKQHIKTGVLYEDDDDDSDETDESDDADYDATINNLEGNYSSIAYKKFRSYILLF